MTKNTGVILSAVATTNQTAASASRPPREARIPSRTRTKITSLTCTRLKLLRKNWAVKTTATASGGQAGLRSGNVRATISRVSQAATTHSAMLTRDIVARTRSEEHTSELQSQSNLVCRLLLEKKKNRKQHQHRND